jgi:hypothetical protein
MSGCEGRDRANPLDPLNPATGGTPDNFNAIADDGKVTLEWYDLGFDDLIGYELTRLEEDTGESSTLNDFPIPPSEITWMDETVTNDRTYAYTLHFLTPGDEMISSLPDRATPGPSTVWAADFNSPAIRKISPDARDLVRSVRGFYGPWDLSISPSGDIWVADFSAGHVKKFDIDGEFLLRYDLSSAGRGRPLSLGYDTRSNTLWIGGRSPDGVVHITDQGFEIAYYASISYPIDIDIDRSNGTVWVASRDTRSVYRLRPGEGSFTAIPGFNQPASLSVDPGSGYCWIADGSSVIVLGNNGDIQLSLSDFRSPQVVAVDVGDGSCWVGDDEGSWSVSRVSSSGDVEFEIAGFDFISDLIVNEFDGSCWVTTVTIEDGEVIKLSSNGEVVGRVGRLAYPAAIDVLP